MLYSVTFSSFSLPDQFLGLETTSKLTLFSALTPSLVVDQKRSD